MRSEPSVQNTQPFIRRESAFASLAQKPVHYRTNGSQYPDGKARSFRQACIQLIQVLGLDAGDCQKIMKCYANLSSPI